MSISIGPTPVLDDLILWYDAASYKCYSGEPTTNQISQDYYGESGVATGDASINLSGLFGLGLISQRPYSHEVWSLDNINKGKLTRYGAYYFDGVNDYLEVADDAKLSFTDGTDDLPMSGAAWVNMKDATSFPIITKLGGSAATSEWMFTTDSSDRLQLAFMDAAGQLPQAYSATLAAYEGQWIHVAFTYGGAGPSAASGKAFSASITDNVVLYVNGVAVSSTPVDKAAYAGMSNTTQALHIGKQASTYANGHIKNVKIFNRELNAGEVYQLYYSNSLNGVVYRSDFSAGTDGWAGTNGTLSGNIDSIGGKNDNLRHTLNTSNAQHLIYKNALLSSGKNYHFSCEVYIPSTNSNLDGVNVYTGTSSSNLFVSATPTQDQWVTISGNTVATTDYIYFYLMDGASNTFQDAGGDDVIYIRNVNIVELDNQSLVDFADEWGEANGATYTSDFSAGTDGWGSTRTTSVGNIDSIGGLDNNLRSTINTDNSSHSISKALLPSFLKKYRIKLTYYIPSTNSNVDGIRVDTSAANSVINETSPALDQWNTVYAEATTRDNVFIYALDGGSVIVSDAGGDDIFYINEIVFTQIGILADFDLANYDDNDKITDRSSNKFIASPQGGALARERWFAHDLSFSKDTDNNDIATITRNPASGAFYENSNSLTLFGEHPLYVTNASTGDKVSVSLQVKSNQTGLFTGINFFNSGTSASESILLNRVILPDDYEYIYGTSNLIATGDNVGFELLMNRDFSSGWNYINLKKPQIELKDHATNYTSLTRSGTNAIVNLANRNLYTGTIVNDVKSSGVAKIDGVQAYYPLSGGHWEFNGVDTSINTNMSINTKTAFSMESVFSFRDFNTNAFLFGTWASRPFFGINSTPRLYSSMTLNGSSTDIIGVTTMTINTNYHAVFTFDGPNKTGEIYLNGQFEKGFSFNTYSIASNSLLIGDRTNGGEFPWDGKIFYSRFYDKALNSQEVNHNYRSIKTKYGL